MPRVAGADVSIRDEGRMRRGASVVIWRFCQPVRATFRTMPAGRSGNGRSGRRALLGNSSRRHIDRLGGGRRGASGSCWRNSIASRRLNSRAPRRTFDPTHVIFAEGRGSGPGVRNFASGARLSLIAVLSGFRDRSNSGIIGGCSRTADCLIVHCRWRGGLNSSAAAALGAKMR
jgi:hypothetical protein